MARYAAKRITWKTSPQTAKEETLRLPPLPREVGDDLYSGELAASLRLGDLFVTTRHLEAAEYPRGVRPHALRYLTETWTDQAWLGSPSRIFRLGTIAVYAGTVRVEEADHKARTVSRLRHTFIIDGSRFMAMNLNLFKKVA